MMGACIARGDARGPTPASAAAALQMLPKLLTRALLVQVGRRLHRGDILVDDPLLLRTIASGRLSVGVNQYLFQAAARAAAGPMAAAVTVVSRSVALPTVVRLLIG